MPLLLFSGVVAVGRWCWVTQCRGILLILDYSRPRACCARNRCGWVCLDIFSRAYHVCFLSPVLWDPLKKPFNPKQPTNFFFGVLDGLWLCIGVGRLRILVEGGGGLGGANLQTFSWLETPFKKYWVWGAARPTSFLRLCCGLNPCNFDIFKHDHAI